ncbi:MAG: hypothetical protein QOK24_2736 [Verrucomicrobiota bacterium]
MNGQNSLRKLGARRWAEHDHIRVKSKQELDRDTGLGPKIRFEVPLSFYEADWSRAVEYGLPGAAADDVKARELTINKVELGLRCVTDYELITLSRVLGAPVAQLVRGAPTKLAEIFASSKK